MCKKRWLPYTFMGVPPEGHHFVDLQSTCSIGSPPPCPERTVLHLGQKVFRKRTANIVVIPVLKQKHPVRT